MGSFQAFVDARIAPWRRGSLLREHGFTIAFVAVGLAALRLITAEWSSPDFHDRLIGTATLGDLDIAARGRVFAQCALLFVFGALGSAWFLPRLARWLGADSWRAMEGLSAAQLLLLWLTAWRVGVDATMVLVGAAQGIVVATALLDRWTRRVEVRERGAYVAWLMGTGFACVVPIYDFAPLGIPKDPRFLTLALAGVAFVLDLVRRVVTLGADVEARGRRFDRCVYALAPLALLSAAPVLRNELYFLANQWGWMQVRPPHVEWCVVGVAAAWTVVRLFLGPPASWSDAQGRTSVERVVGRMTFPWIVGSLVAIRFYIYDQGPSPDFFEPGNAGLMIEQWFDFGRIPFLETFSAHGLADSFFGFVYSFLTGFQDESWAMYDYLYPVLGVLVSYQVLRAWLSSSIAAAFVILTLPVVNALMPGYCSLAGVAVFVIAWVHRQPSWRAWFVFTCWCAFVFVWRLDMGFAHLLGAAFALAALGIVMPEHRPPLGAMLRGGLLALVTLVVVYLASCAWRDVDPVARARDFLTVVGSNQAFGHTVIAPRKTEIVALHVFVVPILVFVTCGAMIVWMRGRVDRTSPVFLAVLGTLFCTGYYFANFPRGLVRHSFVEGSNVMLSSFAFLVLAGSCRWWLPHARRVTVFAVFAVLASLLAFNADIEHPEGRVTGGRDPTTERAHQLLSQYDRLLYSKLKHDRSLVVPWFPPRNTTEMMPFLAAELGPDDTFLDLSNSPMLYFHAKRRSPHWLNHLMIVVGDRLQDRVIEELARYQVPFVVLSGVPGRETREGMPALSEIDGVPFRVRHYRLLRWVYERYDPLTTVGRWQVWIRRDRLMRTEPTHEARELLLSSGPLGADALLPGRSDPAPGAAPDPEVPESRPFVLDVDGHETTAKRRVRLSPERSYAFRFVGRSDAGARIDVELEYAAASGSGSLRRSLTFESGARTAWYRLPSTSGFREPTRATIRSGPGLALSSVDFLEYESTDGSDSDRLLNATVFDDLRALPRVWGEADREAGRERKTSRDLLAEKLTAAARILTVQDVSEPPWSRGILTTKPGFLRDRARATAAVAVGDEVEFARSGRRRVTSVRGPVVFVDGGPLDPVGDGAPASVRIASEMPRVAGSLAVVAPEKFEFVPLATPRDESAPETSASDDSGAELVRLRSYTQLHLRLRRSQEGGGPMIVSYGQGPNALGHFTLAMPPGSDAHDYVVRLGMQYNWSHRPIDWVSLNPNGAQIELERLALEEGD